MKKYKNKLAYLIVSAVIALASQYFPLKDIGKSSSSSPVNKNYILTKHAKCRMKCRHIDDQDISEILASGKKNNRKSDPNKKPCPIVSLEGYAKKDSQHIRVVAATCAQKTKIVTVIDLDNKYNCCLLYTSPSPRDKRQSRMPSSA